MLEILREEVIQMDSTIVVNKPDPNSGMLKTINDLVGIYFPKNDIPDKIVPTMIGDKYRS